MSDIAADRGRSRASSADAETLRTLESIQQRVLWLAVRIVDYANRERPKGDDLKVGGHQASSASMASIMTALYLHDLRAEDRVSVKPHASPVLHAIEYLLGRLPERYLKTLRAYGGLQSYPSRTKDPFPVDYSTGSVGLGAAAPLFGALADRYVQSHFGRSTRGRFISLLGDAELDEGNLWEAVIEPATRSLNNALWVVDLNRQSLDRVVPIIKAGELERQFEASGWNVIELKYGRRLRAAFAKEGGDLLRRAIDEMPNQVYQGLFGASEEVAFESLLAGFSEAEQQRLIPLLNEYKGELSELIRDLGGHDIGDLIAAFEEARAHRSSPSVIFAYTIKGWGLPIAGRPLNHSALLTGEQIDELRAEVGLTAETEWSQFPDGSPEAELVSAAAQRLEREERTEPQRFELPRSLGSGYPASISTQAAFGQALLGLSRLESVAERIVTLSPDVSVSTNLGGWINKSGIWGLEPEPEMDVVRDSPLNWTVSPEGQHVELGISEMNLFLLLGQLGLASDFQGEPLFPIGTVYDPFVCRGLEGLIYSVYSGSRFVFAGTPSGVSLSREGGAHQSTITPGIGIELPGLTYAEPCYASEMEWLLLDGLQRLSDPAGEAFYLRLSTKPIDQSPFTDLIEQRGEDAVQADVLAGGFRLRETRPADDQVLLFTCGAVVPETLAAAEVLAEEEGVESGVICVSSPDRLYRGWRESRLAHLRDLNASREPSQLERLVPRSERGVPIVSVVDGASHSLAFLGSCLGARAVPLGIDRFGQTGSQPEIYEEYEVSPSAIATAALIALEP